MGESSAGTADTDVARRLAAAGEGELLEALALKGEIELGDGLRSAASLCRTQTGLWLVLPSEPGSGVHDLLRLEPALGYRSQVLGDRLSLGEWQLGVPWGRAEQARRMIAQARLRRAFGSQRGARAAARARARLDHPDGPWSWDGPFIEAPSPHARVWLTGWLDADERLLAWLSTDEVHIFEDSDDSPMADAQGSIYLLISDRRQVQVALSPVGDLWTQALAPGQAAPLARSRLGQASVELGEARLRVPGSAEGVFALLSPMLESGGGARLRELARALWTLGGSSRTSDAGLRAAAVLEATLADDALAALTHALLVAPEAQSVASEALLGALARLSEDGEAEAAADLLEWWAAWGVSPELGEVIVEHLCELSPGGSALALPLHEHLRPLLMAAIDGDDLLGAAVLDFVFVEHLLARGQAGRALRILAQRRAALPSEALQDLLPSTPERGGQQVRIELVELVAAAHAQLGEARTEALAELARLQPLMFERVDALSAALEVSDSPDQRGLLGRARIVRALLGESSSVDVVGLGSGGSPLRVRALDDESLEQLRHPAARSDGVLGKLQGALAKAAVPDCSQLKSYCERANLSTADALAGAIADATVMLGLGGVEPFVSRGEKSVGLRAYEGGTSFMLVGGDHLDPERQAFLDPAALRFAITAELAHLRFGHSRVTSGEVWSGTLDLGLTGLGMLVAAAPLLKRLKAPAQHLLTKIGAPAIDRWQKKLARRESHTLASDNSQLIAAHRVMQLTADRAGLLACGDPAAAIRAMFAVHPAHSSQWVLVRSLGLRGALTRETRSDDERERERLEDLAVRVAALLSFYLSSDYADLRAMVFADA